MGTPITGVEALVQQESNMVWTLFIVLAVFTIVLHWCTLIYIDDLKSRIDRRVDEDKWQNEYINQLCSRVSKLEQEK